MEHFILEQALSSFVIPFSEQVKRFAETQPAGSLSKLPQYTRAWRALQLLPVAHLKNKLTQTKEKKNLHEPRGNLIHLMSATEDIRLLKAVLFKCL